MPIPKKENAAALRSAKQRVYDGLLEWLMFHTLLPGEKLNETALADYFAVSRTPVREALMLLAAEGFVEIIPNRGSFAARLSMADADAVYTAITAVQGDIARLACGKCSAQDVRELERLNAVFAAAGHDPAAAIRADEAFHGRIAELAGNPYLLQFLGQLARHVYRFESLLDRSQTHAVSIRCHSDLIAAIAANDPEAADRASTANWMGQYSLQRGELEQTILANGWGNASSLF